ncbi:PH domain-containing protein [Kribbella deserti]|uniref:PH domain-containing protein n=1 Tax=Kribbella deserti TaxID=1926257 RepID=A0ABV6QQJ4_9ACTN
MPDLMAKTVAPLWQFRARVLAVMSAMLTASMVSVFGVIWIRLSDEIKETFTLFQRLTLLFFAGIVLWGLYRMATVRVAAYEDGLAVRNVFKSYRLKWSDISVLRLSPGDAWLQVFDQEGTRLGVLAVQTSDGPRAREAAKDLARIAKAHGAGRT